MRLKAALLCLLAAPVTAQGPTPMAGSVAADGASPGYVLPSTSVHRVKAEQLGRDYDVVVWLPPGYASNPDRRYPVLFTTDMPQSLPLITGLHRRLRASERGMADAIIVGLGYAVGDTGEFSRRRDYTPTPHGDIDARSDMPGRAVAYGEAEGYRLHLRDELFPFLEARYRIDPAQRIYAGHSYGGLFGTHVLLTEPEMFRKYILMSPSLWYGRRLMIARERGYATRHRDMKADVLMMIGAEETVPDPDTEPFSSSRMAMVEDMEELTEKLKARNYPGLSLETRIFPDRDHGSVYPDAIKAGMEWALPGSGKTPHTPCLDAAGEPIAHCRMPWAPRN